MRVNGRELDPSSRRKDDHHDRHPPGPSRRVPRPGRRRRRARRPRRHRHLRRDAVRRPGVVRDRVPPPARHVGERCAGGGLDRRPQLHGRLRRARALRRGADQRHRLTRDAPGRHGHEVGRVVGATPSRCP
ncbi:hypothetical protein CIK52_09115 [Kocuria rosea]|nr:hypothetical protein CIK52_09115 [Kocuria rosea]